MFEGVIVNGRVEPDVPTDLPEGTRVRCEAVPPTDPPDKPLSPLAQRLLALAGKAHDLPPDMAKNHDHYLHGSPKR